MNELIIGDQKYISSKRAAELTGYAKDYVGQLCREGRVEARLVGRSWYVREAAIKDHRFGAQNDLPEVDKPKPVVDTVEKEQELLTYKKEEVAQISVPEVSMEPEIKEETPAPQPEPIFDTASAMQKAWQDWFAKTRNDEPAEEISIQKMENEVEEEPKAIEINRIEEVVEDQRPLPIEEPAEALESREEVLISDIEPVKSPEVVFEERELIVAAPTKPRAATAKFSAYTAFKVALIGIALLAAGVATLNTGVFYVKGTGQVAGVVNYLAGIKN